MTTCSPKLQRTVALTTILFASMVGPVASKAMAESHSYQRDAARQVAEVEPRPASDASHRATVLTEPVPTVPGPKRVIAVGRFDAIGAFTAKYGGSDIGGGLAAMLTTALVESGRFIVVERAQLNQVLTEQELKANALTNPETGPGFRQLAGTQLIAVGSVTEFGVGDKTGGFTIGGSGGSLGSLFGVALSHRSSSGSVAIDLRLIDTTTGQVVSSYRVREPLNGSGLGLSVGYRGINFGSDQFQRTPLGEASRRVVTRAVQIIAREASARPWIGRVVDAGPRGIYINAGTRVGIRPGDRFVIRRPTKSFTDPVTGEVLGSQDAEIGYLVIVETQEKLALGEFRSREVDYPRRGDLVYLIR